VGLGNGTSTDTPVYFTSSSISQIKLVTYTEAAGALTKIGSSLKPNNHREILHAQIRETLSFNRKSD